MGDCIYFSVFIKHVVNVSCRRKKTVRIENLSFFYPKVQNLSVYISCPIFFAFSHIYPHAYFCKQILFCVKWGHGKSILKLSFYINSSS